MKRFFLCFIALTILFTLNVQAVAEKTTYYCRPNDNIYVPLTVIENPNNVVTASFRVHYDANVFDISQIITSNDTITIPVLSNIPAGYPVTVPFHVRVDAAPGTYEISAEQITGYDARENEAGGILLAPMTVTVTEGAVIVSEPEPIQAAGSGTLPDNTNADNYDTNGSYYIDEGCNYTNLPITSGTLQVIRPNEDGTACTQIATSKDNCFTRTRIGSEWGGWMSADDSMSKLNNQFATGTPEIVSNADGTAYKFPSGMMICTKIYNTGEHAATDAWGSLYESDSSFSLGNWAVAFIEKPVVSITVSGSAAMIEKHNGLSKTAIGSILLCRATSATLIFDIHVIGYGRWK